MDKIVFCEIDECTANIAAKPIEIRLSQRQYWCTFLRTRCSEARAKIAMLAKLHHNQQRQIVRNAVAMHDIIVLQGTQQPCLHKAGQGGTSIVFWGPFYRHLALREND